jgi:acyl dehydratase
MLTVTTVEQLRAMAGQEIGVSDFRQVTQEQVDEFAEITGDRQWIHTDPARARETPFGGTIVHGYFTLSLAPLLLAEVLPLDGFAMGVNYGLDRLRFPAPLPVGERVRLRVRLDEVQDIPGGASLSVTLTFEKESSEKPVCVANALYRVFEASQ